MSIAETLTTGRMIPSETTRPPPIDSVVKMSCYFRYTMFLTIL